MTLSAIADIPWAQQAAKEYWYRDLEELNQDSEQLASSIVTSLDIYLNWFEKDVREQSALFNLLGRNLYLPKFVKETISQEDISENIKKIRNSLLKKIRTIAKAHNDWSDFDLSVRIEKYLRIRELSDFFEDHVHVGIAK